MIILQFDLIKMRIKLEFIIFFILIVSSELVFGKDSDKTKTHKNKKQSHFKEKDNIERLKRSLNTLDNEEEKPFWANRGKKQIEDNSHYINRNDNDHETIPKLLKGRNMEDEPFWGTRGRRESTSAENYVDEESPEFVSNDHSNCKNCYGSVHRFSNRDASPKEESFDPFWGTRGRRDSNEVDNQSSEPFWGNRGRRQESDSFPGRHLQDEPFWGARGRRDDEPFWGNRGRRDNNEPFWGNRGRRQDSEPFWGTRGRRHESEPFWGNRGRRDDEPFWGNRGRRKDEDVFWGARGRRKEYLQDSILSAINDVKNDIDNLSRLKKSDSGSFWSSRGRESKLKALFTDARNRFSSQELRRPSDINIFNNDPRTMTDSRLFADEPNYILVERSSRSSGEEDPFYITRGKKFNLNHRLVNAVRDRRGAIEELVKSVRNDPYYIARGKKGDSNVTSSNAEISKVKELICAAVDLINPAIGTGKVKRDPDIDRERRTILKKLAAQLQNDPYFVSRGKKYDDTDNGELLEFVKEVAEKCY